MKKATVLPLIFASTLLLSACQTNSFINDPLKDSQTAQGTTDQNAAPAAAPAPEVAPAPATVPTTLPAPVTAPAAGELPPGAPAPVEGVNTAPGQPVPVQAPAPAAEPAPDSAPQPVAAEAPVKEFTVVAKQSVFEPSTITVNQGGKVVIHLTSADVAHGFSLPDFGVDEKVDAGETKTFSFMAATKGTYSFRCSVMCGEGHADMTGSLIVE